MPSAEVANMIPQMQHFFASQPVNRAYLFGSCSRGEETKDSDVDIMVDLDKSKPMGQVHIDKFYAEFNQNPTVS